MAERKNPNPICHVCNRPTRCMDYYQTSRQGHKVSSWWHCGCKSVYCLTHAEGNTIRGEGLTIKAAREDYLKQYEKSKAGE